MSFRQQSNGIKPCAVPPGATAGETIGTTHMDNDPTAVRGAVLSDVATSQAHCDERCVSSCQA